MKALATTRRETEQRQCQALSHIPRMSVTSVIDILVVAFLIYEFLKLIKGTRAIPMLVAVVILGSLSGSRTSKG